MPDITVSYEGNTIATMSASGTKTFYTAGKYCDDDITLTYVQPGGGGGNTPLTGTITPVSRTNYLEIDPGTVCTNFVIVPETESPLKSGGLTCEFQITGPDSYFKFIAGKTNSAGSSHATPQYGSSEVSYTTSGTSVKVYSYHTGSPTVNVGQFEVIKWRWYAW